MSDNQDRLVLWLLNNSLVQSAVLTKVTDGSVCPCMTSRDSDNPSYSAEWHANNPDEEDCNKTGIIGGSTSNVNIKAIIVKPGLAGLAIPIKLETVLPMGEFNDDDMLLYGTADADNDNYESLDGLTDYTAYITFDSDKYLIRDVTDVGDIGQVARLVRRPN